MTRKTRYLLICLGFVFFMISAPLIVIYVRGLRFDMQAKNFVHTGVLAVNADPASAQVFLDGRLEKESSKNIRFLLPKEYRVSLHKNGYMPWEKSLHINPDQVTWINSGVEKVILFKQDAEVKTLAENISDFIYNGTRLIFYDKSQIYFADSLSSKVIKKFALPEDLKNQNLLIKPSPNFTYALISALPPGGTSENKNIYLVNFEKISIVNVSPLLSQNSESQALNSGEITSLEEKNLYLINPQTKNKNLLANNALTFSLSGNALYFLSSQSQTSGLVYLELDNLQKQPLLENLPVLNQSKIFISENKQIIILSKEGLYKANSVLEKIADGVGSWHFEESGPSLIYSSYGELDYYDFAKHAPEIITRTTADLQNLRINQKIGYAFFLNAGQISGLELDNRDAQNQYLFYKSGKLKKFEFDSDYKNLLVLDGDKLNFLNLR